MLRVASRARRLPGSRLRAKGTGLEETTAVVGAGSQVIVTVFIIPWTACGFPSFWSGRKQMIA
jgi:hypothetical protein